MTSREIRSLADLMKKPPTILWPGADFNIGKNHRCFLNIYKHSVYMGIRDSVWLTMRQISRGSFASDSLAGKIFRFFVRDGLTSWVPQIQYNQTMEGWRMSKKTAPQLSTLDKMILSLQTNEDASIIDGIKACSPVVARFRELSLHELEVLLAHIREKRNHERTAWKPAWDSLIVYVRQRIAERFVAEYDRVQRDVLVTLVDCRSRGKRIILRLSQGTICSYWESCLPLGIAQSLRYLARQAESQKPS